MEKVYETPCRHKFLCSLINESGKATYLCADHVILFQAHLHWCSWCHSAFERDFRQQIGTGEILGLVTDQPFASFRACTKLVWLRSWLYPPQKIILNWLNQRTEVSAGWDIIFLLEIIFRPKGIAWNTINTKEAGQNLEHIGLCCPFSNMVTEGRDKRALTLILY